MNWINKFIAYVGMDRLLHLLLGALIVAQFEFAYTEYQLGPILGVAIVAVLAAIKEMWIDETPDWNDFWYSVIGGMIELFLLIIRSSLFYIPW